MPPLFDYPDSIGAHRMSVGSKVGPASYTEMTAGPVAGGQVIYPEDLGLKSFSSMFAGLSDSGTYRVECVGPAASPSDERKEAQSFVLRWIVVATGAQVAAETNLSAETVRITAFGRY